MVAVALFQYSRFCGILQSVLMFCAFSRPVFSVTHTQTVALATRPYNCPHRDHMMTYHHHRRHKENFIYCPLSLSPLDPFDLTFLLMWLFPPIIRPFLSLPPVHDISLSYSLSITFLPCFFFFAPTFLIPPFCSPEMDKVMCSRLPG